MTQLFEITHEDIKQLNDTQLTDLLRRLLHLEAARSGIAARSVSVALNIDVPDGGEDGRIQWKRGPKSTNYIPSAVLTIWLCNGVSQFALVIGTDSLHELRHREHASGFHNGPFPMHPLGLNGIEPGTFTR